MLRAYLDESGKVDDSDFVAVAGAIASVESWLEFEARWNGVLAEFDAPPLHMKTFAHSTGEFAGWKGDETKRRDFQERLMRVALDTIDGIIGAVIDVRVFRSLDEPEQRAHAYDPYWPCLQDCLSIAGNRAMDHGDYERVEIFVEDQSNLAVKATTLFERCKAAFADPSMVIDGNPAGVGERLDSINVRTKVDSVSFQLADWLAYEITKEAKALAVRPRQRPRRWPFEQFMSYRGYIAVYGTKEALLKKSPLGAKAG